jgi:predicted MPP superfamily phosphohydrolase
MRGPRTINLGCGGPLPGGRMCLPGMLCRTSRSGVSVHFARRHSMLALRSLECLLEKGTTRVSQHQLSLAVEPEIVAELEQRLGRVHARQRLGMEASCEQHIFGHGINFFHPENWYAGQSVLRAALKCSGLYWRGRANTARIRILHNRVSSPLLPPLFDGFTILQISDLHADMSQPAMARLVELLPDLRYDVCVLTGDFRGLVAGPFDAALESVARVRPFLREPLYGVLGNHDTIRMVPALEGMGIRMLLNESEVIALGDERIHLAGVDDAHYYRADNIEKAASDIRHDEFSILLSHTPEIYRQAAHADFNVMLSGHTHGGQLCLPGSIPLTLDSVLPRRMGSGAWKYEGMFGYTSVGVGASVVEVRFNCPPEITLHHLHRG